MRNMSNTLRVTCPAYIGTSRNTLGQYIADQYNKAIAMGGLTVAFIKADMAAMATMYGSSVEALGLGVCGAPE